jgi:hypothetical protein
MMAELEERRRIESEWQAFGRVPERVRARPNVRQKMSFSGTENGNKRTVSPNKDVIE